MKVGILAGGMGTRMGEETERRPKPMVEVGSLPILWHIMKHYESFGLSDFAVALGYKGEVIKRFFVDRCHLDGDLSIDMRTGGIARTNGAAPRWRVDLVETGLRTGTGGRIKRLLNHFGPESCFVTWGDGVSNVDIHKLLKFHKSHGKLATLTAVRPPARFGHIQLNNDAVTEFSEKNQTKEGWINGAFFVLEPGVADYIAGDETMFEREPLEKLAQDGQLAAYKHEGFWQCMDTLRDKKLLERLWTSGDAPWKTWED